MSGPIILGDSHVACMKRALDAQVRSENKFDGTKIYPIQFFVLDNTVVFDDTGTELINPLIVQALSNAGFYDLYSKKFKTSGGRKMIFCFGGSESHLMAFKKFWTENTLYVGGGIETYQIPIVPRQVLALHFELRLKKMFQALRLTASLWDGPIAFLGPPPPHRDNSKILARFPQLGKIAAPSVRLEIYLSLREVLQAGARRSGVPYFDAHAIAACDDDFLKVEYEGDGIHGNDAYGRSMLELVS